MPEFPIRGVCHCWYILLFKGSFTYIELPSLLSSVPSLPPYIIKPPSTSRYPGFLITSNTDVLLLVLELLSHPFPVSFPSFSVSRHSTLRRVSKRKKKKKKGRISHTSLGSSRRVQIHCSIAFKYQIVIT